MIVSCWHDQYPFSDYPSPWDVFTEMIGDFSFTCPSRETARLATTAGMDVFIYFFVHKAIIKPYSDCTEVCHFSEVPFVFDFQPLLSGSAESTLAQVLSGCTLSQ